VKILGGKKKNRSYKKMKKLKIYKEANKHKAKPSGVLQKLKAQKAA